MVDFLEVGDFEPEPRELWVELDDVEPRVDVDAAVGPKQQRAPASKGFERKKGVVGDFYRLSHLVNFGVELMEDGDLPAVSQS